MDPGHALLQRIKTIPNLINEDPSVVTPKNTSFMDLPWSDFSKLLANQEAISKGRRASATSTASSETCASSDAFNDAGNWDAMTGFQDNQNVISRAF